MPGPREEPLGGGNASGDVVRIGDTIRKPWTPTSGRVAALLDRLRTAGIDVPRHRGRDGHGRQVLEYVPGRIAQQLLPLPRGVLARVGALVRAIHDASPAYHPGDGDWEVLLPADTPDLVCHNDLAPWNLVVGDERLVFVDWDGAGPSTRLWDLAYAAQAFALNDPARGPDAAAADLGAFVDGYDPDVTLRAALPDAMAERADAMRRLLHDSAVVGREPWATMDRTGHGAHWDAAAAFLARHRDVWAVALG